MEEIVNLIEEHGYSVVLMGYFLIKDWKFNNTIITLLQEVKEVMSNIKTMFIDEVTEK